MSKKEIVIADVVDKYDNPIAELVQVACQFSSSLYLVRGNPRPAGLPPHGTRWAL